MGNIPLPALSVKAPEISSPLDQFARVENLRAMMRSGKIQDMQLQQIEQQRKDEQVLATAVSKANGNMEQAKATYFSLGGQPTIWARYESALAKASEDRSNAERMQTQEQRAQDEFYRKDATGAAAAYKNVIRDHPEAAQQAWAWTGKTLAARGNPYAQLFQGDAPSPEMIDLTASIVLSPEQQEVIRKAGQPKQVVAGGGVFSIPEGATSPGQVKELVPKTPEKLSDQEKRFKEYLDAHSEIDSTDPAQVRKARLAFLREEAGATRAPQTIIGIVQNKDTGEWEKAVLPKKEGTRFPLGPTAEMRNKEHSRKLVIPAIDEVEKLGRRVITEKTAIVQKAKAAGRSIDAALANDPEYRTYQDGRVALAGNLAVLQQGSRPSDADIKDVWLPLVPDAFRDTKDSADMKWQLIRRMSGVKPDVSGQTGNAGTAPPVGTVKRGYRFKGGNPADKNNWVRQ